MNWKEKLAYRAIIFVIVSASVFYFTPVRTAPVEGHSMEPTISDGDAVIIIPETPPPAE